MIHYEMHSADNERKSVVNERFVGTLKNKIYKYMTSMSIYIYIDKLADIVNKYNNKYHNTTTMKPVNVNSSTHIDFDKENNKVDLKIKVGYHVRISKYENCFAKSYIPNWS